MWHNRINHNSCQLFILLYLLQNNEYSQTLQKYSDEYIGENEAVKQIYNVDIRSKVSDMFGSKPFAHTWNKGVEATFEFLADSPILLGDLAEKVRIYNCKLG